jgi:hypothetical protein
MAPFPKLAPGSQLTVLCVSHGTHELYWKCRCSCGKETTVRVSRLQSGETRSCGCLRSVETAQLGKRLNRKMKSNGELTKNGDGVPQVPVGIEESVVLEPAAVEALQRLGAYEVPATTMRDLQRLGLFLRGTGTLRTERGRALVSEQNLQGMMSQVIGIAKRIEPDVTVYNSEKFAILARVLSDLAKSLTASQRLMVDIAKMESPKGRPAEETREPQRRSFEPRAIVQPINVAQVHVHGNESKEKAIQIKTLPESTNGGNGQT